MITKNKIGGNNLIGLIKYGFATINKIHQGSYTTLNKKALILFEEKILFMILLSMYYLINKGKK